MQTEQAIDLQLTRGTCSYGFHETAVAGATVGGWVPVICIDWVRKTFGVYTKDIHLTITPITPLGTATPRGVVVKYTPAKYQTATVSVNGRIDNVIVHRYLFNLIKEGDYAISIQ